MRRGKNQRRLGQERGESGELGQLVGTVEEITATLEPGAEDKEAGLEIRPVSHTMQVAVEAVGEIAQGTVWKETE